MATVDLFNFVFFFFCLLNTSTANWEKQSFMHLASVYRSIIFDVLKLFLDDNVEFPCA